MVPPSAMASAALETRFMTVFDRWTGEPEIFKRIAHILLPKDYVRLKLTGEFALDRAGGAGTLLFDIKERSWSSRMIKELDIDAGDKKLNLRIEVSR